MDRATDQNDKLGQKNILNISIYSKKIVVCNLFYVQGAKTAIFYVHLGGHRFFGGASGRKLSFTMKPSQILWILVVSYQD